MDLPLTEFDTDRDGLLTPTPPALSEPLPERVVMCFFPELLDRLRESHAARRIGTFSRELGGQAVYLLEYGDVPVGVFHPGVGAPLAVLHLERAIAAGGRMFVACGGAGAVIPGLALGHVVIPNAAVRDEGTSYHYAPAGRVIEADPALVRAAEAVLTERGIPFTTGMTWTTDAPFRETRSKVRARREEGCVTVEMETAAFLAVAKFRGVGFCQYLYAGDDVSGPAWDHRGWTTADARSALLDLSLETATRLPV